MASPSQALGPNPESQSPLPPPRLPLIPWRRLWPVLRQALTRPRGGSEPDLARVLPTLARGRTLTRMPWRQHPAWVRAWLILDASERLLPFWDDFIDLRERITRWRGTTGLRVQAPRHGPLECLCRPLPPPGTPVLVVGDLGLYDQTAAWQRVGKAMHRAGLRPVALLPCAPEQWTAELAPWFRPVFWDRQSRLSRQIGLRPPAQASPEPVDPRALLSLLAPAIRIEPALLRAARFLFPARQADARWEMAAWRHPEVQRNVLGICLKPERRGEYRLAFQTLPLARRQTLRDLLFQHHAHLDPLVLCQELDYAGFPTPKHQAYLAAVVKSLLQNPTHPGIGAWVSRAAQRHDPAMWAQDERLTAAWLLARRADRAVAKPAGLDERLAAWTHRPQTRSLGLIQQGTRLVPVPHAPGAPWPGPGSPLYHFTTTATRLDWREGDELSWWDTPIDQARPLPPGEIRVRTERAELRVAPMSKPTWAEAFGRDEFGLFAEFVVGEVRQRMRWIPPGRFILGSPEAEAERFENELPHEVELSQGFWLADTACSQALWTEVMEENPSRFQGEERPVDTVSWNEAVAFLAKLNGEIAGLEVRLPTEAEWEYACRAGTQTLFYFGENVTTAQANYDGNFPYANPAKGTYREQTVEVKALPPNAWGLYQMHGNVWE